MTCCNSGTCSSQTVNTVSESDQVPKAYYQVYQLPLHDPAHA